MGIIVAGAAGIGKTSLSLQHPNKVLDLDSTPLKYEIDPDVACTEATKASHDWPISEDWPHNYVDKIREVSDQYEFIMIAPDMLALILLRLEGIPYVLVYPERSCRDEYRARFIQRGNSDEFLRVFIDGWDRFIDAYEQTPCATRLVLRSGEFITLDRLREAAVALS